MVLDSCNVPSKREGDLICVGTVIKPGEDVPRENRIETEIAILVVPVLPKATAPVATLGEVAATYTLTETVPAGERLTFPGDPTVYRRFTDRDEPMPGQVFLKKLPLTLRRLEIGDMVKAGQLLAVVNPAITQDELAIKVAKLDAAEADRRAAIKTKEEAERRYEVLVKLRARNPRLVPEDDFQAARLAAEKYTQEMVSKTALLEQAKRELCGTLTTLKMHTIRAPVSGEVKQIYKFLGEGVKNLDTLMHLQSTNRVRVEGQVEVQEAPHLRQRLLEARALFEQGKRDLDAALVARNKSAADEASRKMAQARQQLRVMVEASRPERPLAVLKGHHQAVTCVAVSKGPTPLIVSGSEDHTVRIWKRVSQWGRWQEHARVDSHAVVRAVACTGPTARENLLLAGTATGRVHLFNLDTLKPVRRLVRVVEGREVEGHAGAVTCVAFSPDGTLCATGGDDLVICLWNVATGELQQRISSAHKAALTCLQFISNNQLLSAGRDKCLLTWNIETGKGGKALVRGVEFDRRSGDVAHLGAHFDAKTGSGHVLFDEGRELRVLSLADRRIKGVLQNPVGTANFAHLALFSPDGNTILTSGDAPGRLQLWRAPSPRARAAELRQLIWNSEVATCGAFAPDGSWVVTGTRDHQVLVWPMPGQKEVEEVLWAQLTYVEGFLDSTLKRVPLRAELDNPGWLMPGSRATLVIPPLK
jgi:WD40 repeat protein